MGFSYNFGESYIFHLSTGQNHSKICPVLRDFPQGHGHMIAEAESFRTLSLNIRERLVFKWHNT